VGTRTEGARVVKMMDKKYSPLAPPWRRDIRPWNPSSSSSQSHRRDLHKQTTNNSCWHILSSRHNSAAQKKSSKRAARLNPPMCTIRSC